MKKSLRLALPLPALFLLILWASCSKSHSSGNPNGPSAKVILITQSTWRYDTSGIDLNKDGIVDIGDTLFQPCTKDNIYTFKSDSTGTMDEGLTKCIAASPQTVPFTWSLTNNQTVLTSTVNPLLAGGINIFSLTASNWILYKDSTVSGISVRYILNLKH